MNPKRSTFFGFFHFSKKKCQKTRKKSLLWLYFFQQLENISTRPYLSSTKILPRAKKHSLFSGFLFWGTWGEFFFKKNIFSGHYDGEKKWWCPRSWIRNHPMSLIQILGHAKNREKPCRNDIFAVRTVPLSRELASVFRPPNLKKGNFGLGQNFFAKIFFLILAETSIPWKSRFPRFS